MEAFWKISLQFQNGLYDKNIIFYKRHYLLCNYTNGSELGDNFSPQIWRYFTT